MMQRTAILLYALALIVTNVAHSARVQDITIPSPSMDKQIPGIVILPESYFSSGASYPAVYLLHGYSSSPRQTLDLLTNVFHTAADNQQMIIFLPDGGYNSWYFDSPAQPARKYETFIAREFVHFSDKHYRTIPFPWARAITGGSMGGHGGLFIGLRHKDVFGSVGSLSGGVDFRPFPENWDIKQALGPIDQFPKRWDEHVVLNNLDGLKPGEVTIYMDVGTKDLFVDVNRALHKKLLAMDIPHVYVERPGHHDDPYWKVAVSYQLSFFGETFKDKQAASGKTPAK